MARQGRLRFSRLSIDNTPVSIVYHLRGGNREYNLQMGFDDGLHSAKMSLGLLHLGYEIERAALEGTSALDLLAGQGKQGFFKQRIAPGCKLLLRRHHVRSKKARVYYFSWHLLRGITGRELPSVLRPSKDKWR